ncbi:MAG: hypothetical protein AB1705_01605 [Verrucomicrobiota bacterium]
MQRPDLFLLFVRPMNRAGIRYMVSGSVASIFYGEPRMTVDVDCVVFLNSEEIRRLPETFPPSEFYLPPIDSIAVEVARPLRGQFNIIHHDSGFKADIYSTGRDELNAWGFRGRRQVEFEGELVTLAPPEYVIIRKLEFLREGGSDKHVRDIQSMFKLSGDKINRAELDEWIRRRGLETQWKQISET